MTTWHERLTRKVEVYELLMYELLTLFWFLIVITMK
jgi:hypothetical protein